MICDCGSKCFECVPMKIDREKRTIKWRYICKFCNRKYDLPEEKLY